MLARADQIATAAMNDDFRLIRIERSRASWTTVVGVVSALTMGLSLFGGMILVASQALSEPETLNLALARPMATLQIVAGHAAARDAPSGARAPHVRQRRPHRIDRDRRSIRARS